MGLLIRFWREIAIGVLAVAVAAFCGLWLGAVEKVGVQKERVAQLETQDKSLRAQLKAANDKINATANAAAASFSACQGIAATDATTAFNKGVTFGKATCATRSPTAPSRSSSPPAQPARR